MKSQILTIITINLISFCGLAQPQETKVFDLIDLIELSDMNLEDAKDRLYKLGYGKIINNKNHSSEFTSITFETNIEYYANGNMSIITAEGKLNNVLSQLNSNKKIVKLGSVLDNDGFQRITYLSSTKQFLVGIKGEIVKILISQNKGYDSYKD